MNKPVFTEMKRIASALPEADLVSDVVRRLTYGDIPQSKALQLTRLVMKDDQMEGLPPPEYAEEVGAQVSDLVSRQEVSQWLCQAGIEFFFPDHRPNHFGLFQRKSGRK
jgi:hypothetical protein